jgi:predicted transcriptional regulator
MDDRTFADDLRDAIAEAGVTQERLEELSGVSQSAISKILKGGDPKLSTVRALEAALPRLRNVRHVAA